MTQTVQSNPRFGWRRFWRQYFVGRAATAGLLLIGVVIFMALTAGLFYPDDPLQLVAKPTQWPLTNAAYPLGTDALGRDIAAIMMHGARTTLFIGLLASFIATLVGTLIGSVAGYYGGWVDEALMRLTDVFQTIPNLILLLAVVASLGPKTAYIMAGIGLSSWTGIARLARAQFLTLKTREFVQASHSMGIRDRSIILDDILPNALPPVIVMSSLLIAAAVLFEAALAFLGFTDPDVASWGRLLGEGRPLLRNAWYVCVIPGAAIFLTVLGLNLVGDGINDALNPRLRRRTPPENVSDTVSPPRGSSNPANLKS